MNDVLLFAGTTEGRLIAEACLGKDVTLTVSVATEYGETMIETAENVRVLHGRKEVGDVVSLIRETGATLLIDATHPYAEKATETLLKATERTGTEYLRVVRREDHSDTEGCVFVDDTDAAVRYLNDHDGNALLTVGAKELRRYTEVRDCRERLYARILPMKESADTAFSLGFFGQHLICMQGPFDEEMNKALLRALPVRYLVTKDTGAEGGFPEKIKAARSCGVTPVVIRRPVMETGISANECVRLIGERFGWKDSITREIAVVGIGMGHEGTMTEEAALVCEQAELIVGAKRVTDALIRFRKPVVNAVGAEEIERIIRSAPQSRIVVAMSGDTGFFSGAKRLTERLSGISFRILPGVSSVSYFASKLCVPYDGAALLSAHGRKINALSKIRANARTFLLVGGEDGVKDLLNELTDYGFGHLSVAVGSDLSYPMERIVRGTAESLKGESFPPLSIVYVKNPSFDLNPVTHGRDDTDFLREDVPMTKSEVRAVTLSRLKLKKNAVCWDVGAGTGSVSIEMAECCEDGAVYAVERDEAACALIERNKRHLGVSNVTVIRGEAPEALCDLPAPTHVFVGGSGGNLMEILRTALKKNPRVRIVINTVTAETFSKAIDACKSLALTDPEITELFVSRSVKAGPYHMMRAQNPVYVIAAEGKGQDE